MIKVCEHCNKKFETKNGHNTQRFCSKSCATSSRFPEDDGLFRDDIADYIQKYILGLIITDGCITKNNNNFIICISLKDKEMIEQIKNVVCKTKRIYRDGNNYQVKWRNSHDVLYLEQLGITQRKTYTVGIKYFSNNIWHLVRGLFDGDGCVYKSTTYDGNKHYTYTYVSFTSASKQFVDDLSNILSAYNINYKVNVDSRRKDSVRPTYYIKINKQKDVIRFKDLMYMDCNNWKLDRKYNLFV